MLLQLIRSKKIIAIGKNERIHYSITKRDRSCNKVKLFFSFLRQALTIVTKKSDDQKKEKTN